MWASICESNWERTEVSLVLAMLWLNPHYRSLIIVLFLFLLDILTAAVACNYVAIICFLASNWCSIAVIQSQIMSITNLLAWQVYLECCKAIDRGQMNVCLNLLLSLNPSFQSFHWFNFITVWPTAWYRRIIRLQSQREEIIDMYFSLFSSPQVKLILWSWGMYEITWICISVSSLLIFWLCACHAFLTNPLSWLCDVL